MKKLVLHPVKYEKFKFGIIIFITLASINIWSFQVLSDGIYKLLETISYLLLVTVVIYNLSIFKKKNLRFKLIALFFLLIPLLSVYTAIYYHNQSPALSLLQLRVNLFWLLYFVLHIFNISPQKIIKLLLVVGIVWVFLTIIQQFTFPYYYFYTRSEQIFRAGVYRFMIIGEQYGLFALIFCLYRYLLNKKNYNLFYTFISLIGFYFYGTRQYLAAAVISIFITIILLKGSSKWKYLLILTVCGLFVGVFYLDLFSELIEITNDQLDNEDYIRFLSADYFLNEYWPHWSAKLMGNGRAHGLSDYGQEMEVLKDLGFHRSDVGIIGAYSEFGIFYILNIIAFFIGGIFTKFNNIEDKYLKIFFFYFAILSFLSLGFSYKTAIPFYCFILYLVDKSLELKDENELIVKKDTVFEEVNI